MGFTLLKNSTLGAREETTPYSYLAPTASYGILLRQDMEVNLDREFLEDDTLNGSLSHSPSEPGMWSDDLGGKIPVYARSGGTGGSAPEFAVLLKSIMGNQWDTTDNTVDNTLSDATTTIFKVTTTPTDLEEGQLILVDVAGDGVLRLTQIIDVTSPALTVWPPLPSIPIDGATIYAGTNFSLLDADWPTFSGLAQFDASASTKLIKYTGCRCTQMVATFEPGKRVPIDFTFIAISPEYDNDTIVDFAGSLDTTTRFLTCLGVDVSAIFAGVTKGTPTTTQTILSVPDFGVKIGDEILIDAGTLSTPTACTFTNATDLVNDVAHGLSNGDRVRFYDDGIGGALPAELSETLIYYVVNKNDDDFQVSLTLGGSAIDFTDDGTGTFTYSEWTKGTGAWETLAISNVTGNAGEDTTITHATASNRADPGDTVYVKRKKCASIGDALTLTVDMEAEAIKCMAESYGKAGIEFNGRAVTIEKNPWFQDWQEFLLRDGAVGSELILYMGTETGKIMAWYLPNIQNMEVSITGDNIRRNEVSAQANRDTRIGNKNELIIACF